MMDRPLMVIRCPICRCVNGKHKMDCQSEPYSSQFLRYIEELELQNAALESALKSIASGQHYYPAQFAKLKLQQLQEASIEPSTK